MNLKQIISVFIITTFLGCCIFTKAQTDSDTIIMVEKFADTDTVSVSQLNVQQNKDDEILQVSKKRAKEQPQFSGLVKFKPVATIAGLFLAGLNLELAIVPYVTSKVGIPIEIQIAYIEGSIGFALLTGIEAVPFTHREKSGLYLNFEVGTILVSQNEPGFCTMGHFGYQLVTKGGFVLTPALGFKFDTITYQFAPHILIDIGFALKRKK